ncbi:MAG: hypothetical protein ACHQ0J_01330 [Candidatus Dormibacterales bacterium]
MDVAVRLKRSAEVLMDAHQSTLTRLLEASRPKGYYASYADGSDLISQTFWHNGPSVMLSGFALENLLKGILVARDPSRVRSAPKMLSWRQNHDLVLLSAEASVQLTSTQIRVMRRLTDYTTWAGRYPTAMNADHMKARVHAPTGGATWDTSDNSVVDQLYESLRQTLEAEIYRDSGPKAAQPSAETTPLVG